MFIKIRIKYNSYAGVLIWLCKTKIWRKSKIIYYMDKYSFTVYIKNDDVYKEIPDDAETWSDTSNYELLRLLPNTA